jgi:hypothetical protein
MRLKRRLERLEERAAAADRAKKPPFVSVFERIQQEYDRLCRLRSGEASIDGTPPDVQQAGHETPCPRGAGGEAKGSA